IPSKAGVPVPCPAPHGGSRMACFLVGRIGKQPARQVLPAHQSRTPPTGNGTTGVGAHLARHRVGIEGNLRRFSMFVAISRLWRNLFDKQTTERELDDEICSYR